MKDDRDSLKVGDDCYITDNQGVERKVKVASRKRKWLTAGGYKFDTTRNYGGVSPFGYTPVLYTIEQRELLRVWQRLRYVACELTASVGYHTWQGGTVGVGEVKALTSQIEVLTSKLQDFLNRT